MKYAAYILYLSMAIALLLGCSAAPAPASQSAESVSTPPALKTEPNTAQKPSLPTPEIKMFQADSIPPKAIPAVNSDPNVEAVEVGYKIGMHVPEFGMSLLDGTRVTSESLVDEGTPVFIYFHATW